MKRGLILTNAYSNSEHSLNQSKRLKEELEKMGVAIAIKRNDFFIARIDDNGRLVGDSLSEYDFCIYLDKDKYVSLMLEKCGMRLFNNHHAIEACDDKMLTAILLSDNSIPMPYTLPGLLCYDPSERVKQETLDDVAKTLGFPLIVKSSYGSLGKDVFKADDMNQLRDIADKVKCAPHVFQRYVKSSFGKDIRIIAIGGKVVAAMLRSSNGDFRSNLELGGVGKTMRIDQGLKRQCERIASLLGLDYCGIDVLLGEDKYYICEVNSNAFFCGFEAVTGINVAQKYAEHICREIYGK